jgi:hypothetical protein
MAANIPEFNLFLLSRSMLSWFVVAFSKYINFATLHYDFVLRSGDKTLELLLSFQQFTSTYVYHFPH